MHEHVTAAIIAGGQATRLGGRDKSRLVVRGRSIIIRQLDVLQRVAARVVIVSSHADGRFEGLGLDVVPDVLDGIGPIAGVLTALEKARTPMVIAVACDLPFLDVRVFERLISAAAGADGAWVTSNRGPEPLLACYETSAAGRLRRAIGGGLRRLTGIGDILTMHAVPVAELAAMGVPVDVLDNINTPEDLARIQ